MKLPGLTDEEIREWLAGPNIARLGTLNDDGTPRLTALWYLPEQDGMIALNTYEDNVHVEHIRRDGRVALLVDLSEQPYKSVHYNSHAEVEDRAASAEEIARLYVRDFGYREAAFAYAQQLVSGGKRLSIRFTPERSRSIDFGKLGSG